MKEKNKCYQCAELENCRAGQYGEGKPECKGFCPCFSKEPCIIIERSKDWIRLINRKNLEVICEGHSLMPEDILLALDIDFRSIEKKED